MSSFIHKAIFFAIVCNLYVYLIYLQTIYSICGNNSGLLQLENSRCRDPLLSVKLRTDIIDGLDERLASNVWLQTSGFELLTSSFSLVFDVDCLSVFFFSKIRSYGHEVVIVLYVPRYFRQFHDEDWTSLIVRRWLFSIVTELEF